MRLAARRVGLRSGRQQRGSREAKADDALRQARANRVLASSCQASALPLRRWLTAVATNLCPVAPAQSGVRVYAIGPHNRCPNVTLADDYVRENSLARQDARVSP